MKLKLINIIGILLTILIVGGILYPWSKNNVEGFVIVSSQTDTVASLPPNPAASLPPNPAASLPPNPAASLPPTYPSVDNLTEMQENIKTIYQNLLETKLYADDFENRINKLKEQVDKKLTVNGDDYIKLINDIQVQLQEKIKTNEVLGYNINTELQNDEINEINNNIESLTNKIKSLGFNIIDSTESPQNSNIVSIKSVHNGVNLNVKNLSMTNLDEKTYKSILPNLSPTSPTIMIFLNNGCLKYVSGQYTSNNCELTNVNQYFVLKTIENGTELLKHLDGIYLEQQKNINQQNNLSQYPFNIIYPISNMKKCVKVDIDGISIEDCRPVSLNLDQRWISSPISKQICY